MGLLNFDRRKQRHLIVKNVIGRRLLFFDLAQSPRAGGSTLFYGKHSIRPLLRILGMPNSFILAINGVTWWMPESRGLAFCSQALREVVKYGNR